MNPSTCIEGKVRAETQKGNLSFLSCLHFILVLLRSARTKTQSKDGIFLSPSGALNWYVLQNNFIK